VGEAGRRRFGGKVLGGGDLLIGSRLKISDGDSGMAPVADAGPRARRGYKWHLDEVFLTIGGMKNCGQPCAGEPHSRLDQGGQARACSLLYLAHPPVAVPAAPTPAW